MYPKFYLRDRVDKSIQGVKREKKEFFHSVTDSAKTLTESLNRKRFINFPGKIPRQLGKVTLPTAAERVVQPMTSFLFLFQFHMR